MKESNTKIHRNTNIAFIISFYFTDNVFVLGTMFMWMVWSHENVRIVYICIFDRIQGMELMDQQRLDIMLHLFLGKVSQLQYVSFWIHVVYIHILHRVISAMARYCSAVILDATEVWQLYYPCKNMQPLSFLWNLQACM